MKIFLIASFTVFFFICSTFAAINLSQNDADVNEEEEVNFDLTSIFKLINEVEEPALLSNTESKGNELKGNEVQDSQSNESKLQDKQLNESEPKEATLNQLNEAISQSNAQQSSNQESISNHSLSQSNPTVQSTVTYCITTNPNDSFSFQIIPKDNSPNTPSPSSTIKEHSSSSSSSSSSIIKEQQQQEEVENSSEESDALENANLNTEVGLCYFHSRVRDGKFFKRVVAEYRQYLESPEAYNKKHDEKDAKRQWSRRRRFIREHYPKILGATVFLVIAGLFSYYR